MHNREAAIVEFDQLVTSIRTLSPVVQCLTNYVVPQVTARAALAIGASPVMVDSPEEVEECARMADGILINLGTPTSESLAGMRIAIDAACELGKPWILDPVGVGMLSYRTEFARDILRKHPAAIRGVAAELRALQDDLSPKDREREQREARSNYDASIAAALRLAERQDTISCVSGVTQHIISPGSHIAVSGTDPLSRRVVGMDCAMGGILTAYLAAAQRLRVDSHLAAVAATAHAAAATVLAAQTAQAPGSFVGAWIDQLFLLDGPTIRKTVRIREV